MVIVFFYRHIVTLLLKVNTNMAYKRDNNFSTSSRIVIFRLKNQANKTFTLNNCYICMSNAETKRKLLESSWISSAAFTKVQGDFSF